MSFRRFTRHIFALPKWQRGCLLLFFVFVKAVLSWIINCIAFFQFLHVLFTDLPNVRIMTLANILNRFLYQVASYLTYTSDEAPFPFNELEK